MTLGSFVIQRIQFVWNAYISSPGIIAHVAACRVMKSYLLQYDGGKARRSPGCVGPRRSDRET